MTEPGNSGGQAVAFIGLGMMGLPMATRLMGAGFAVRGHDISDQARHAFATRGGAVFDTPRQAATGISVVVTMLPNGQIVRDALFGARGAAEEIDAGATVIDMSSSAPLETKRLAEDLARRNIHLVDAPVSGGVRRAADGSLAIMAGGDADLIARVRPVLDAMGATVTLTGPVGSGHAVKALNNYVSAAGLAAACEAALIAERFGVDPEVLVDVLNVSTGRNNSTELKMKPFVLSGTFASGFSMALMAKDLGTAAELAEQIGCTAPGVRDAAALWADASAALGKTADHTEIYRFLAQTEISH